MALKKTGLMAKDRYWIEEHPIEGIYITKNPRRNYGNYKLIGDLVYKSETNTSSILGKPTSIMIEYAHKLKKHEIIKYKLLGYIKE